MKVIAAKRFKLNNKWVSAGDEFSVSKSLERDLKKKNYIIKEREEQDDANDRSNQHD